MSKPFVVQHRWYCALLLLLVFLLTAKEPYQAAENSKSNPDFEKSGPLHDSANIAKSVAKSSPLRILVIGAHPADVFDQSGGTMAHHVERGDWVGCAVVTTGVRTHDKVVTDEMQRSKEVPAEEELKRIMAQRADVKTKEVVHACSILGVRERDIYFLGGTDAILLVNEPMIRQIAKLIRKLRPDVILTHLPTENMGWGDEHATTGQMVMHAIRSASGVDPGDTTPPHKITQVFFFGQGSAAARSDLWGAQGGFYNDIFVDISDVAEKKIACLDAMESQGYGGDYARKRIETSDGAFGSRVRVPYAEGFISLYSTTQYYLPISEIDLQHSKASDHEGIKRRSYRINVP
jgi:4-oxalomesaconate hydratase